MYRIFLEDNDFLDTDYIGAKLALTVFELSDTEKRQALKTCREYGTILITDKKCGFEVRIDYIKEA